MEKPCEFDIFLFGVKLRKARTIILKGNTKEFFFREVVKIMRDLLEKYRYLEKQVKRGSEVSSTDRMNLTSRALILG